MFLFRLAIVATLTLTAVGYLLFKTFYDAGFKGSNNSIKVANWNSPSSGYSFAIFVASFFTDFQTFFFEVCFIRNDELKVKKESDCFLIEQRKDENE